tara:strand:+ start:1189 stop:1527 length:339 start_codon:yes stop_codon:yes gene_type:complete
VKILTFTQPNNLSALHDELIIAIPTFARTKRDAEGMKVALPDCGQVKGRGDDLTIIFANSISEDQVTAVIQAHDPSIIQPDRLTNARETGRQKLIKLGLTDDEVSALTKGSP